MNWTACRSNSSSTKLPTQSKLSSCPAWQSQIRFPNGKHRPSHSKLHCAFWLNFHLAKMSSAMLFPAGASFDGGLGDVCCALCRDGGWRRHLKPPLVGWKLGDSFGSIKGEHKEIQQSRHLLDVQPYSSTCCGGSKSLLQTQLKETLPK